MLTAMPQQDFVSPSDGLAGWLQNRLANAEWIKSLRRMIMARLPFMILESDVREIVYANWRVPVASMARFIPPGVEVMEADGWTVLTVLTYKHGHFGPWLAGPLRRIFPSPLQSNWRLYVTRIGGVAPDRPTVLFLANIFDNVLYAVGTRMFSDAMLAQHASDFEHEYRQGRWMSRVAAQAGWHIRGGRAQQAVLPGPFQAFFKTYDEALRLLCLQDAAIAPVAGTDRLALAGIELPIDVATAVPLAVEAYEAGGLLTEFGATEMPFCFCVPQVKFRVISEQLMDKQPKTPNGFPSRRKSFLRRFFTKKRHPYL
jgi:hypothetical protein